MKSGTQDEEAAAASSGPYASFNKKRAIGIGVVQIIIGVLLGSFNIATAAVHSGLYYVAYGFWNGIILCAAGSVVIFAAEKLEITPILAAMVMCIVAVCSCIACVLISIAGLVVIGNECVSLPAYKCGIMIAMECAMLLLQGAGGALSVLVSTFACGVHHIWSFIAYTKQWAWVCGLIQIMNGVVMFFFSIGTVIGRATVLYVGHGLWAGFVVFIAGMTVCWSGNKPNKLRITISMIMSIMAACVCAASAAFSLSGLLNASHNLALDIHHQNTYKITIAFNTIKMVAAVLAAYSSIMLASLACTPKRPGETIYIVNKQSKNNNNVDDASNAQPMLSRAERRRLRLLYNYKPVPQTENMTTNNTTNKNSKI